MRCGWIEFVCLFCLVELCSGEGGCICSGLDVLLNSSLVLVLVLVGWDLVCCLFFASRSFCTDQSLFGFFSLRQTLPAGEVRLLMCR